MPCDEGISLDAIDVKLACGCIAGRSGGARLGTAGVASIEGVLETSMAVGGLSGRGSVGSGRESVGSVSVDLNFCESDLVAVAIFPLDLGGAGVDGSACISLSSSSTGDVVNGLAMGFPLDGNRGLCTNVPEPELGCVRCERSDADLLTLCPMSDTLDVRLRMLLFLLWCPFAGNRLFSTPTPSATVSSGGLTDVSSLGVLDAAPAAAWVLVSAGDCFLPVNLPKTLDEVERDGIPPICVRCGARPCGACLPALVPSPWACLR